VQELAVKCDNLEKRYGDVVAVDGLSLHVRRGECFGLLGPNGAGKTTTIEILEGLLAPDTGHVEILGLAWRTDERELRERLGIHLQETQLSEKLTVEEMLRLFRSFYRRGRPVGELLEIVALEGKRRSRVGALSGGQKQRLSVACALATRICCFSTSPRPAWIPSRDGSSGTCSSAFARTEARFCSRLTTWTKRRRSATGSPSSITAG
jgi:ABC-2 type transport system ATP-binding protein